MSPEHLFTTGSDLSFDIYPNFFDWILLHEPFTLWLADRRNWNWQLRVVGAPGSGKSTLSALVLDQLQQKNSNRDIPIAAIFIQPHAHEDGKDEADKELVARILESIHLQLNASDPALRALTPDSPDSFHTAAESLSNIALSSHDLDCQRAVLHDFLNSLESQRAFLVLDSIDTCSFKTWLLIEDELELLRQCGLSIMVTSRVPLQRNVIVHWCDVDSCETPGKELNSWEAWKCKRCYDEEEEISTVFTVCDGCKAENCWSCPKCGQSNDLFQFHETCKSLEIDLDDTPNFYMSNMVLWLLQSEHGNLNFEFPGSENFEWPPHSALGRALLSSAGTADSIVQEIVYKADQNVTIARLRAEALLTSEAIDDAGGVNDRLPRAIVELFDVAIRRIAAQSPAQASLGLKSIVLAITGSQPVPVADLLDSLQLLAPVEEESQLDDRQMEEVLHATLGFLSSYPFQGLPLKACHQDFELYVSENYSDILFNERQTIPSHLGTPKRSLTIADPESSTHLPEKGDHTAENVNEVNPEVRKEESSFTKYGNTTVDMVKARIPGRFRKQVTWA